MTLPPPPRPRWELRPSPDPAAVERLVGALSLPTPLCRVLAARGLTDPEEAKKFLRPTLDQLAPPDSLTDARRASQRILKALAEGETILVHGDYDVDGVASTALLTLWLRRLGGKVVPFVPHRMRDGYDLGPAGLEAGERAGATLLITCDSGISAHEAVREAGKRGMEVIVTDHHTPGATLPPALAVVNPNRSDCGHPEKGLCGAGVVFALCRLLARERGIPEEELLPHLDLVALATIADLVPLQGENRVLARFGLRALAASEKPGIRALMEAAGVDPQQVDEGTVGFALAPRINAAGRVGAAATALELLLSDSLVRARELALELEGANRERRQEDERTADEAVEALARTFNPERDFGVVVAREGWHPGVIGIVASRVVERVHRPTILVALEGERGRGSARSIPGVHLYEAVARCASHLRRFGGHRQAAGMELAADDLPKLQAAFNEAVRDQVGGTIPPPVAVGDAPLPLAEATEELHHYLRYLGPFGMGNPRPTFWARGVELVNELRTVGKGHVKLRLRDGNSELEAMGWGMAERLTPEAVGRGPVDVLFHLRENDYRGRTTLQARLRDLRPSAP